MGERSRRARRWAGTLLLFGALGAATSVAVAWGVTVCYMATLSVEPTGVRTEGAFGLTAYRGVSRTGDGMLIWRLPEDSETPSWSRLSRPPSDAQRRVTVITAGWPLRCLAYEIEQEDIAWSTIELAERGALYGRFTGSAWRTGWHDVDRLPMLPVWPPLLADVLVWGFAWWALFSLPNLWRINRWKLLSPKGICAWCRYDLAHAKSACCPECGHDAARRPPLVSSPTRWLAMFFLITLLVTEGIFLAAFIEERPVHPIHIAAFSGDVARVRGEIERGADLDEMVPIPRTKRFRVATTQTMSPLMLAVQGGHTKVVRALLEAGAMMTDPNVSLDAVGIAVEHATVEILEVLIEHGLDVDHSSTSGISLLELAADTRRRVMVEALLAAGADSAVPFRDNATLLHVAALSGWLDLVERLLDEGHDIDAATIYGETPLHAATRSNQDHVARVLIERGADVNAVGESTPLFWSVLYGNVSLSELLIEHGADVNLRDPTNTYETPLVAAARGKHPELMDLLLEHGADVNAASSQRSMTVLQAVAGWTFDDPDDERRTSSLDMIRRLLDAGAEVNEKTGGSPALTRAIGAKAWDVVEYLLDQGAEPDFSALTATVRTGHVDLYRRFIDAGVDPLVIDSSGRSLLHFVPRGDHPEWWQMLIDAGIDVNAVDQRGYTMLMHAARDQQNRLFVKFLLERGADPTVKQAGETALDKATIQAIRQMLEEAEAKWIAEHGEPDEEARP